MTPAFPYSASDNFDSVTQAEYVQPFAKFVREIQVHFLMDVFLGVLISLKTSIEATECRRLKYRFLIK